MNASRPEANAEYSTSVGGQSPLRRGPRRHPRRGLESPAGPPSRPLWAAPTLGIAGALALLVAQFTALLRITTVARHPVLVRIEQTGPHHGWAPAPIAGLALVFAALAWRTGSRAANAALALLGLAAFGVALLVDLPGVHATGIVAGPAHGLRPAQAHAGIGLYLETLGAALLMLAAAAGLLL